MARKSRLPGGKGFTLIEVTLAIVIGVIMIAGATLLYNQSKISSGNSRAQAKVLALQQLIEEYSANNAGTYPTVESVRSLWKRKRPDDYLKSPWGGQIGPQLQKEGDTSERGVMDNSSDSAESNAKNPWGGTLAGVNTIVSDPLKVTDLNGGVSYSLNKGSSTAAGSDSQDNTTVVDVYDVMTNITKKTRGYNIWVYDSTGRYPNFVAGGKEK